MPKKQRQNKTLSQELSASNKQTLRLQEWRVYASSSQKSEKSLENQLHLVYRIADFVLWAASMELPTMNHEL
jgi:hypothetical protein